MSFEFISGLALVVVTLGVLIYIVKEFFDIRLGDLRRVRQRVVQAYSTASPREAKPVNSHLIGVIGQVVGHSGDSDRPMRVRLNFESWPARPGPTAVALPAVGSSVEVTEVDGAVLVVEAADAPGQADTD